ncbi:MAG: L,D-transpeptidase family protein [Hyphomicrobiaceae bacterium]
MSSVGTTSGDRQLRVVMPMRRVGLSLSLLIMSMVPASAVTIELKDAAPERIENQRRYNDDGAALPGTPDLTNLEARLRDKGMALGSPMLMRVFKSESEVEVWLQRGERYELFATYPVCNWSGSLGPKLAEGDKQTPEGFYTVTYRQLHRIGRWPRSLNLGFPNAYDRSLARTGSYILMHGGCSSVGCFAMTDPVIAEIYQLTNAAIRRGQAHVPVHVFPFRMTEANLSKNSKHDWALFWRNLQEGYDAFEQSRIPPRVSVCDGRYVFESGTPGEVGEPGPLGVCGGSLAAMRDLEEFALLARSHPQLRLVNHKTPTLAWREAETLVPPHLAAAFARYRVAMSELARLVAANARLPPARRRNLKLATGLAPRSSPYKCNTSRASCRKHIALAERRADRATVTAARAKRRGSHSATR